mmetsp:Transcript_72375/g.228131  ORF Transcript_72375/g.228131 Transcript_72375/m.228131 type:complete len:207 (-) Transcript_72375:1203-1823(-)
MFLLSRPTRSLNCESRPAALASAVARVACASSASRDDFSMSCWSSPLLASTSASSSSTRDERPSPMATASRSTSTSTRPVRSMAGVDLRRAWSSSENLFASARASSSSSSARWRSRPAARRTSSSSNSRALRAPCSALSSLEVFSLCTRRSPSAASRIRDSCSSASSSCASSCEGAPGPACCRRIAPSSSAMRSWDACAAARDNST